MGNTFGRSCPAPWIRSFSASLSNTLIPGSRRVGDVDYQFTKSPHQPEAHSKLFEFYSTHQSRKSPRTNPCRTCNSNSACSSLKAFEWKVLPKSGAAGTLGFPRRLPDFDHRPGVVFPTRPPRSPDQVSLRREKSAGWKRQRRLGGLEIERGQNERFLASGRRVDSSLSREPCVQRDRRWAVPRRIGWQPR